MNKIVQKRSLMGLAGYSGSGKTTLICALLSEFCSRGLSVSTIKHAHHCFDVDKPGKDSYRHRTQGAHEVMVASATRWALMHENRTDPEPKLAQLLQQMAPVDWVLIEGFKKEFFPKIFIHRSAFCDFISEKDLQAFCGLVAIATDKPEAIDSKITLTRLDLDNPSAIVDYILTRPNMK